TIRDLTGARSPAGGGAPRGESGTGVGPPRTLLLECRPVPDGRWLAQMVVTGAERIVVFSSRPFHLLS
ncbi:MAG: hypothetical protein KDA85_12795, partial [Planctomycetaceae bacterium]|nr:hypothetical protein [Planctomycetaceae bacterium]